jgi:uncharacterized protein YqeY
MDPLRQRLRTALTDAMKKRDANAVSALRTALAAIDNAESVDTSHAPRPTPGPIAGALTGLGAGEVPRLELTERDIEDIVRTEITAREHAADDYDRLNRPEEAARLRAEAAILRDHLGSR